MEKEAQVEIEEDIQELITATVTSTEKVATCNNQKDGCDADDKEKETSRDPKRRSSIYSHFTLNPTNNKWKCNYCRREYQKPAGGGTGSLHNHMNKSHASKLTAALQQKVTDHYAKLDLQPNKYSNHNHRLSQEEFIEKLIKFVVSSNQPFSLVEEPDFKDLITEIQANNPELILPNRNKMKELITSKYTSMKEEIKKSLMNTPSRLNFVIDCWTSATGHPFQGVIVSWIGEEWTIKTATLDLTRIVGTHSGENLGDHFIKVIDDYGIYEKLLTITTDNAANMGTLFKRIDEIVKERNDSKSDLSETDQVVISPYPKIDFNSSRHRIRCLAHILNLSCRAILDVLDKKSHSVPAEDSDNDEDNEEALPAGVIDKLRKAVKKIRNSQEKRDFFRKQCTVANLKANELILDVVVRWNSTLNMIERALSLKGPFILTLSNFSDLAHLQISPEEWMKLKDMKDILLPFKEATLLFSKNAPMLSSTLHIYEILFAHLESYLSNTSTSTNYRNSKRSSSGSQGRNVTSSWLESAAYAGWMKLKKYYPSADGLAYKVATVMDPTRKDKWYTAVGWNKEWITAAKSDVRRLWNMTYKSGSVNEKDVSVTTEPPSKRSRNAILEKIEEQMMSIPRGGPEDELTRYLREPCASSGTDILDWWKRHEDSYPNLSKMARDYLSIFGTGVPVERLFSSATDTLTHRRFRLSPASVNQCLCLKSWFKFFKGEMLHSELADAIKDKILGSMDEEEEAEA